MRILKQIFATILLALILSASVFAGDMGNGGKSAPAPGDMGNGATSAPAPGDMPGPTLSGDMQGPTTKVFGDVSIPTLTAIASLLGLLAG